MDRKVTVKGDKVFLTGKVGNKWDPEVAAKWEMLGIHQWIMEPYETKHGTKYRKVLNGPYPEITKKLMKQAEEADL